MPKTIVITGTSSGVGLALGNYFHEKGYLVFGLSRSIPEKAKFITIPTDVTQEEQLKNAFQQISTQTERIDLLINNAGRGMVGAISDASEEEILHLFQLNLVACIRTIHHALTFMRKRNKGKIINISSLGSIMGLPFRGYYSASKSALDMATEALRFELRGTEIEACTLNLGDVRTNIAESRIKSSVSEPYQKTFEKVYSGMNAHVDDGFDPKIIAPFIEKLLLQNKKMKPHYYFGVFGQKISLFLKAILPQKTFENLIAKYSGV